MTAPSPLSGVTPARLGAVVAAPLLVTMAAYAWRAAFHSDELNVLFHVGLFAQGDFAHPGRPGLLWLALTPLMLLDDPVAILHASRVTALLAICLGVACIVSLGSTRTPHGGDALSWADRLLPGAAVALLLTSASFAPHAIEVRTDTFTTPLTLLALAVLWRRQWTPRTTAIAAVVVVAAVLCSQKSAYNAVGLALAWLLARPARPDVDGLKGRARDAGIAVGVVAFLVAGWYLVLALASGGGDFVSNNLQTAASTAFAPTVTLAEKMGWLAQARAGAPLLYAAAIPGVFLAAWRARTDGRVLASALVAVAMYGVLPVHRGYFPYYIASIEPFLALPAALTVVTFADLMGRALARVKVPRAATVAVLTALVVGFAANEQSRGLKKAWRVTNAPQVDLAARVHSHFGGDVPYLAGLNLVPGYPEKAGYLTGDVRRRHRMKDRSFIATLLKSGAHFFVRAYMSRDLYLRPNEAALIYRSYLPVSPNLYLHGARARWTPGTTRGSRTENLFVTGKYTVRFRGVPEDQRPDVFVDGVPAGEGDVLELSRGAVPIVVGPSETSGEVWIVLGEGVEPRAPGLHADYSLFPKDRNGSRGRYQKYDTKKGKYDLAGPPSAPSTKRNVQRHRKRLADLDARFEDQVLVQREPSP
ncbi:MAG: hypothetical protein KDA24_06355 [Deltaproteobacteria bacterium]|nr:hypothetical protein [Deltaproteobacteria bacterium]